MNIIQSFKDKYNFLMEDQTSYIMDNLINGEKVSVDEIEYVFKVFTKFIKEINLEEMIFYQYAKEKKSFKEIHLVSNSGFAGNNANIFTFEIKNLTTFDKIKNLINRKKIFLKGENEYTNVFSLSIDMESFGILDMTGDPLRNQEIQELSLMRLDFMYSFYKWIKEEKNININIIDKVLLSSSNNARLYVCELLHNKSLKKEEKSNLLLKIKNSNISIFKSYITFNNKIDISLFDVLNKLILEFSDNKEKMDDNKFKETQIAILLLGSPQGITLSSLFFEKELVKNYFNLFNQVYDSLTDVEKKNYINIFDVILKRNKNKQNDNKYILLNLARNHSLHMLEKLFNNNLFHNPNNELYLTDEIKDEIYPQVTWEIDSMKNIVCVQFNINNLINFLNINTSNDINIQKLHKNIVNTLIDLIKDGVLHKDLNMNNTILNNNILNNNILVEYMLLIEDMAIYSEKELITKNIEDLLKIISEKSLINSLKKCKKNFLNNINDNMYDFGDNMRNEKIDLTIEVFTSEEKQMIKNKLKENNLKYRIEKIENIDNNHENKQRKKI